MWRKMKLPKMTEHDAEKVWITMAFATYDGDVPLMKALRSSLRWRTTTDFVQEQQCLGSEG